MPVGRYLTFLEQHHGGALSLVDMGQVTAADIRAFLAHRQGGDHPPSTRFPLSGPLGCAHLHRYLDRRCDTPNAAVALVRGPKSAAGRAPPVTGIRRSA